MDEVSAELNRIAGMAYPKNQAKALARLIWGAGRAAFMETAWDYFQLRYPRTVPDGRFEAFFEMLTHPDQRPTCYESIYEAIRRLNLRCDNARRWWRQYRLLEELGGYGSLLDEIAEILIKAQRIPLVEASASFSICPAYGAWLRGKADRLDNGYWRYSGEIEYRREKWLIEGHRKECVKEPERSITKHRFLKDNCILYALATDVVNVVDNPSVAFDKKGRLLPGFMTKLNVQIEQAARDESKLSKQQRRFRMASG